MKKYLMVFVSVLISGCCSQRLANPLSEFKLKNPIEYAKYVYIYPISLDSYYCLQGQQRSVTDRLISVVNKQYSMPTNFSSVMRRQLSDIVNDRQLWIEDYATLEEAALHGGIICQFKRDDGHQRDMGMLVIKNGTIVKQDIWITDFELQPTNHFNSAHQP